MKCKIAQNDTEIMACFPTIQEFRLHLIKAEFLERIKRQASHGFKLAYVEDKQTVRSVAG